jgi:CTP:molybdopterin cytidylyltransferase MocA
MISVFCTIKDATISADGDIYLILRKDKPETSQETVRKLKQIIGEDSTIIFTGFDRRSG